MQHHNPHGHPLELWVGPEPTVSRLGAATLDQLELTGFARRPGDIDRLGSLGAAAVRFPLLWERTAPDGPESADWGWADTRLQRLHGLGVRPIVGLVHHGNGPRHTHLLDPGFASGVQAYARAVAERYPDLRDYTPVNEPLTTARFAALYGHWYPHARSERAFWAALFHQLQATVLAMREIRQVNPAARLIQTEDLGHTLASPALGYQADFENERRWLTFDLLLGRLTPDHPLWGHLRWLGAPEHEVMWFAENPCPPDVLGLNVYVTSERFLDDRLEHYPSELHGGNGRDAYADVEAVRVHGGGIGGAEARLLEAHARYGLPLAVTEAHLGCTREEQLRWLQRTWQGAQQARAEGADVRAVTAWSAFGAFEWNSLLTRREGHYESGLWDLRAPEPRPTALVELARELAAGGEGSHPVLAGRGWWERPERLLHPAHGEVHPGERAEQAGPPLLITGATGTLGQAFARACAARGLPHVLLTRAELDITDPQSVAAALDRYRPWALVNTAGYVRVDDAEADPRNDRENAEGPRLLAGACALRGLPLLTFSSDLVFGGEDRDRPYVESDEPHPLNAYGRSKLAAERAVLDSCEGALMVRTSAFFGPWDVHNFAHFVRQELTAGRSVRVAADQVITPTYVPDLVHASLNLLIDGERGLWHLSNGDAVSWAEFARQVAAACGLDPRGIEAVPTAALHQAASRPRYSALDSERGWPMPGLASALERWAAATVPGKQPVSGPLRVACGVRSAAGSGGERPTLREEE